MAIGTKGCSPRLTLERASRRIYIRPPGYGLNARGCGSRLRDGSNVSRGRMLPKGVDEETDERLQRRSDAINPSTEAAHQGAPTLAQLDESSEAIW